MNMVYPPDQDWAHLAELTGDESFSVERMRELFIRLENSQQFAAGTPGHGFDGYLAVCQLLVTTVAYCAQLTSHRVS